MICLTANETNAASTMPELPGAVVTPNLEELCGADMMISPLDAMPPTTPKLLALHISRGAVFYQIKRGMDLASSVANLWTTVDRMRAAGIVRQSQRGLLFVGHLSRDSEGNALIDGLKVREAVAGRLWQSCQTALDTFNDTGGVVVTLDQLDMLPRWVKVRETQIKERAANRVVTMLPEQTKVGYIEADDPLQVRVIAPAPIQFLAAFDGIGEKGAQVLFKHGGSALAGMFALTSYRSLAKGNKLVGIGKGRIDAARAQLGIPDGFDLALEPVDADDEACATCGRSNSETLAVIFEWARERANVIKDAASRPAQANLFGETNQQSVLLPPAPELPTPKKRAGGVKRGTGPMEK